MFSNTGNANLVRWQTYVKGDPIRQEILETALNWVSGGDMDRYMAEHRSDDWVDELRDYFETVVDWVDSVFEYTGGEMRGQDWSRLYREYHKNAYSKESVNRRLEKLTDDSQVTNKRGVIDNSLAANPI